MRKKIVFIFLIVFVIKANAQGETEKKEVGTISTDRPDQTEASNLTLTYQTQQRNISIVHFTLVNSSPIFHPIV